MVGRNPLLSVISAWLPIEASCLVNVLLSQRVMLLKVMLLKMLLFPLLLLLLLFFCFCFFFFRFHYLFVRFCLCSLIFGIPS